MYSSAFTKRFAPATTISSTCSELMMSASARMQPAISAKPISFMRRIPRPCAGSKPQPTMQSSGTRSSRTAMRRSSSFDCYSRGVSSMRRTNPCRRRSGPRVASSILCCLLASGVAVAKKNAATEGMVTRQDLEIVDCLLPGVVRSLGNTTYVTQRRPTRTTATDCHIRGGEYTAYDRADYKSTKRVWMSAAEAGDAEAQNNVGEIYERGIGGAPYYEAAVIWYQKAADQGYARALFNLGTLYEQGQGVEQDRLKALNLYRKAWGLPEDNVMYASAARHQQEQLRAE